MLKLYNTIKQKKQEFKPLSKKEVTMYSCGPTVYDRPHIGNLASFLTADLLKRYLKWSGYNVKHVMNLTDVDDKTIKSSRKAGVGLETYTKPYIDAFFQDLDQLNIERAQIYPKATDYITQIVELVKKLVQNKHAYLGDDGSYYFKIKSFPKYGKLVKLDKQKLKTGCRISQDNYGKRNIADFALWKAWSPEDGDVFWETELGRGRPGWHIECSAMSTSILGATIDIHTGAIDLKFPHHTNEIAQSEGATNKPFVRFWVHRSFLRMGKEKMAKSSGNVINLDQLIEKSFQPKVFRYLVLTNHYRTPLIYTEKSMKSAKNSLKSLEEFVRRLKTIENSKGKFDIKKLIDKTKISFQKYMDDDLNTPRAIAVIFNFIRQINKEIDKENLSSTASKKALEFLIDLDKVWGFLKDEELRLLGGEEQKLLEERLEARRKKDFLKADKIRDTLKERGIEVRDEKDGKQSWIFNN